MITLLTLNYLYTIYTIYVAYTEYNGILDMAQKDMSIKGFLSFGTQFISIITTAGVIAIYLP